MIKRFDLEETIWSRCFGPETSGLNNSCIRGEKLSAISFQQSAVLSIQIKIQNSQIKNR